MSVRGQSRRFGGQPLTSALRQETDIGKKSWRVSKVPKLDLG